MQRKILLAELPQPFIVKDEKVPGIEKYDTDNAYPSRMERLINGSVTAKSSAGMLSRFLIGQGFEDEALVGNRAGQRSSRLNKKYRVIYTVNGGEVTVYVLEVTPHKYKEK